MIPPQQLTYQQIVSFAQQLPLAERVQLVREILAEPMSEPQSTTYTAFEETMKRLRGRARDEQCVERLLQERRRDRERE